MGGDEREKEEKEWLGLHEWREFMGVVV